MFNNKSMLAKPTDTSIDRRPRPAVGMASVPPADGDEMRTERPASSAPVASPVSTRITSEPAPAPADSATSRLIVGPDVKLRGAEILDCDTLVVEGRVEATMDSRVITIAKQGAFAGKVGIDVAEIHGQFEGELTARQQLVIHATGRVRGKIRYGKLLIEAGGVISGDVESLAEAQVAGIDTPSNVKPLISSTAG